MQLVRLSCKEKNYLQKVLVESIVWDNSVNICQEDLLKYGEQTNTKFTLQLRRMYLTSKNRNHPCFNPFNYFLIIICLNLHIFIFYVLAQKCLVSV